MLVHATSLLLSFASGAQDPVKVETSRVRGNIYMITGQGGIFTADKWTGVVYPAVFQAGCARKRSTERSGSNMSSAAGAKFLCR
jgi:hypothetical protein